MAGLKFNQKKPLDLPPASLEGRVISRLTLSGWSEVRKARQILTLCTLAFSGPFLKEGASMFGEKCLGLRSDKERHPDKIPLLFIEHFTLS